MPSLRSACVLLSVLAPLAPAQNLGGGAAAPHGAFVKLDLESWIPGRSTNLRFHDLPAGVLQHILIVSTARTSVSIPGFAGTLIADISPGKGLFAFGAASNPVTLPSNLNGQEFVIQGCIVASNGRAYFTDATLVRLFKPMVMVGNSRQSSNSINVIDLDTRQSVQRLSNSELGRIVFSRDRSRAFVTEPGSQRNRIVVYDISKNPVTQLTTIPLSGGVRYRCAATADGKRLYVPIHNGIAVIDTDKTSATLHQELRVIPTPITGTSGAIFTGPMSVALGFAETRLYIAYGENVSYPAPSTMGVIDLTQPGTPHRAIPIQTGGTLLGLATRMDIEVSPDGLYVYALEWGVNPVPTFTLGYSQGGYLNIVSTVLDKEVAAIPTMGVAGQELCVDRNGRDVWIAHCDLNKYGEILRVDVDSRSSKQFSIRSRIRVSNNLYSPSSSGPMGIDVTPDGSTVCFSVCEGTGQSAPEMWTLDARSEMLFGTPVAVESLPGTLSITQY